MKRRGCILGLLVIFILVIFTGSIIKAGSCDLGVGGLPVMCDAGAPNTKCTGLFNQNDGANCPNPGDPTDDGFFLNQNYSKTPLGDGEATVSCLTSPTYYYCNALSECNGYGEYKCSNLSFYEHLAGDDGDSNCDGYQCNDIIVKCAYTPGSGLYSDWNWWVWGDALPKENTITLGCTDGHDNDCNGYCDSAGCGGMLADPVCGCPDGDGDGFGKIYSSFCTYPQIDCNDSNSNIHPSTTGSPITEVPGSTCTDGLDNDCDGPKDCGDTDCSGDPACITCSDPDGDGYNITGGSCGLIDCDEGNPQINPGIIENGPTCYDGVDNNCDGNTDYDNYDGNPADPDCILDIAYAIPLFGYQKEENTNFEVDCVTSETGMNRALTSVYAKLETETCEYLSYFGAGIYGFTCYSGPYTGSNKTVTCGINTLISYSNLPTKSFEVEVLTCTPNCVGRECGDDGCGGSCGTCEVGIEFCNATQQCEEVCVGDCTDKECGDDGCGVSCGECENNYECFFGNCFDNSICTLIGANWNASEVLQGELAKLEVYGTSSCNTLLLNPVEVWEHRPIFWDRKITALGGTYPDPFSFIGPSANGTWLAEYLPLSSTHEYYFKVFSPTGQSVDSGSNYLKVRLPECEGIQSCDNYQTEEACNANECSYITIPWHENAENLNLGPGETQLVCGSDDNCEVQNTWTSCGCFWDTDDKCKFTYSDFVCSEDTCDGVSRDPGEDCDGSDLDGYTSCADFGLNGVGPVTCNSDCTFDLSGCGISCNINGVVDFGSELCEPGIFTKDPLLNDGPLWTCSDFDNYDDTGILTCTNCMINTSECSWPGENQGFKVGSCFRQQENSKGCDEEPVGFYTSSWEGKWTWGHSAMNENTCNEIYGAENCILIEGVGYYYDPNGRHNTCVKGGETIIECPVDSLSFFNYSSFLVSLIVIALLYFIFFRRNK